METGEVSEKIKRGKHTTRHSELIYIGEDTYLMDTPGFSSLFLENIEKEDLKYYFPEFAPYENTCKFNGCCHIHEPGCEVKKALEEKSAKCVTMITVCFMRNWHSRRNGNELVMN